MEKQVCLEEALTYSKKIMLNLNTEMLFSEYCQGFFCTNECIKEYLSNIPYSKERALTVLSSGDHVFNLIHDGVKEIDAFDLNKLQYYVYFLRRALILAFSYQDFLDLNLLFMKDFKAEGKLIILHKIKNLLPPDVYLYFKKLIQFSILSDAKFENLYYNDGDYTNVNINNYLACESEYEILRKKLEKAKVNLYFENAINIPKIVPAGNYDIVLLSNVADYISKYYSCDRRTALSIFFQSFLNITNDGGCVVNYLFGYFLLDLDDAFTIPICEDAKEDIIQIKNKYCSSHGYYLARRRHNLQKE